MTWICSCIGITRWGFFASCVHEWCECDEAAEALREWISVTAPKFLNGSTTTCGLQSCMLSSDSTSRGRILGGEPAGVVATEDLFHFLAGGPLSAKESTSLSSTDSS
jgi:hypothetical protein